MRIFHHYRARDSLIDRIKINGRANGTGIIKYRPRLTNSTRVTGRGNEPTCFPFFSNQECPYFFVIPENSPRPWQRRKKKKISIKIFNSIASYGEFLRISIILLSSLLSNVIPKLKLFHTIYLLLSLSFQKFCNFKPQKRSLVYPF